MAKSQCNCCDGYESWLRREEIRHGGVVEEELPYRKSPRKPRKKKIPKHKHNWELSHTYDWYTRGKMQGWYIYCTICHKRDFMWI